MNTANRQAAAICGRFYILYLLIAKGDLQCYLNLNIDCWQPAFALPV
jgi:hypothetical protein